MCCCCAATIEIDLKKKNKDTAARFKCLYSVSEGKNQKEEFSYIIFIH